MQRSQIASALIGIMLVAAPAFARDNGDDNGRNKSVKALEKVIERLEKFELPEVESANAHPQSVFIGPQGQARIISGEITSIASPTMNVKVWGLTFPVNIASAR